MPIKQCTIITAYKGVLELDSLLHAVHSDMACFVHIDLKNNDSFSSLKEKYPDVFFYSKYSINWGGFEHLQAILFLMKEAIAKADWDYVHVISGEDYPVISVREMGERLIGKDNIYTVPILATGKDYLSHKWYAYRWPYVYFSKNYRKPLTRYFNIACVLLQMAIPFLERKGIGRISEVYHAMVWSTYPRDAVEYILQYLIKDTRFLADLKSCKIPEELCFSTILMNSIKYRKRICNQNLRYWRIKPGDWGPPYLVEGDIESLGQSDAFWARKVKVGSAVSDYLHLKISESK